MHINIPLIAILQLLLFIVFLILPPWFAMLKYFKGLKNKVLLVFLTAAYIVLCVFIIFRFSLFQNTIPFIEVLICIFFIYKTKEDEETLYYMRPIKGKRGRLLVNALLFRVFIAIVTVYFTSELVKLGLNLKEQQISNELMNAKWGETIMLSIVAVGIAPVLEEFIFRHILYRNFSKKIGRIWAAFISSFLFALLHFNIASSAATFGLGMFNCYSYEKNGYRSAVLNHFIFNLLSVGTVVTIKILTGVFHLKIA